MGSTLSLFTENNSSNLLPITIIQEEFCKACCNVQK